MISTVLESTLDFSNLKQLDNLDVNSVQHDFSIRLPASLHSLNLSNHPGPGPDVEENQLAQLVHFSYDRCGHIPFVSIQEFLEANFGDLTSYSARGCVPCEGWLIELVHHVQLGSFINVETLILDYCTFKDEIPVLLAKHTTALKFLSLASTQISGVGLRPLLTGIDGTLTPRLEFLCLDNCTGCSLDAVEWARSLGVKTSFKFDDGGK